jgi:hypothetical protein
LDMSRTIAHFILLATLLLAAGSAHAADTIYRIRIDHWTQSDERGFDEFLTAIGDSNCGSVDARLRGAANAFRASDPADFVFRSDCADLPYVLRFYYAWKRGLPFSYAADVAPVAAPAMRATAPRETKSKPGAM